MNNYGSLDKILDFIYGKTPSFDGNQQKESFFYHFRFWFFIGKTWMCFSIVFSDIWQGLEDQEFNFRLGIALGLWIAMWLLVRMSVYVSKDGSNKDIKESSEVNDILDRIEADTDKVQLSSKPSPTPLKSTAKSKPVNDKTKTQGTKNDTVEKNQIGRYVAIALFFFLLIFLLSKEEKNKATTIVQEEKNKVTTNVKSNTNKRIELEKSTGGKSESNRSNREIMEAARSANLSLIEYLTKEYICVKESELTPYLAQSKKWRFNDFNKSNNFNEFDPFEDNNRVIRYDTEASIYANEIIIGEKYFSLDNTNHHLIHDWKKPNEKPDVEYGGDLEYFCSNIYLPKMSIKRHSSYFYDYIIQISNLRIPIEVTAQGNTKDIYDIKITIEITFDDGKKYKEYSYSEKEEVNEWGIPVNRKAYIPMSSIKYGRNIYGNYLNSFELFYSENSDRSLYSRPNALLNSIKKNKTMYLKVSAISFVNKADEFERYYYYNKNKYFQFSLSGSTAAILKL